MTNPIIIEVLGIPKPAGSKRGFIRGGRVIISDANPNSRDWKTTVSYAAEKVMSALQLPFDRPLLEGPLEVHMTFKMPRVGSHYRSNGQLKPNAPLRPVTRPDALKLARGTEDALTGVVWRDDSQIVIERLEKVYAEKPGATITITPIQTACEQVVNSVARNNVETNLPGLRVEML